MTNPDYKALCAELVESLENARGIIQGAEGTLHISTAEFALPRARAALAQPEPEAPTDEEVAKIIFGETYYAFGFDSFPPAWGELEDCLIRQCCVNAARAVITRWGRPTPQPPAELAEMVKRLHEINNPTPQPVAVSERLPGDALSWWYEPDEDDDEGYGGKWTLLRIRGATYTYTHWLPSSALPLPVDS